MSKIEQAVSDHPHATFAVAIMNWLFAGFLWFFDHATQVAGFFALAGAIFGCVASYYAMRVNRRNYNKQVNESFDS